MMPHRRTGDERHLGLVQLRAHHHLDVGESVEDLHARVRLHEGGQHLRHRGRGVAGSEPHDGTFGVSGGFVEGERRLGGLGGRHVAVCGCERRGPVGSELG